MKTRFYEYLTRVRNLRGYTQAQMAEKLGISRSTYTNYERGNRSPDLETLEHISDVLGCTLDELFGRSKGEPGREVQYADLMCEPEGTYDYSAKKKRLAIGVQDFRFLRERNAYYVDKTQFIEEFLDSWYQVTLVTRPRRFGKTLNMTMLREFLDCTRNSARLFAETKIEKSVYADWINQYPVIFLSFLNVKAENSREMIRQLSDLFLEEYDRYMDLTKSGKLSQRKKEMFFQNYRSLSEKQGAEEQRSCLCHGLKDLCGILEEYYGKKVFLLLDEYDTPFMYANSRGYYGQVREILSGMLSFSLKGNSSLEKAMLTGVQRVAKENIFSGLNNLMVCTVKDPEYKDCFGFTEEEVRELLDYCEAEFSGQVKAMYDGYKIGDTELYNPWSISCYGARKKLESYWVNTSENSILKNALREQGQLFFQSYEELLERGQVTVNADAAGAYYENQNETAFWGLLLNAGMVTIEEEIREDLYKVRVPNLEVWKGFQDLTASYLQVEEGKIDKMLYYLQTGDMERFSREYKRILLEIPSYYNLKDENSYHMMRLGMCVFLRGTYQVRSNRESGRGRGDILLYSRKWGCPSMILEFKYTRDKSENLEDLALKAIGQIKEKNYSADMTGQVWYVGLAHRGKEAAVKWEKQIDFPDKRRI